MFHLNLSTAGYCTGVSFAGSVQPRPPKTVMDQEIHNLSAVMSSAVSSLKQETTVVRSEPSLFLIRPASFDLTYPGHRK